MLKTGRRLAAATPAALAAVGVAMAAGSTVRPEIDRRAEAVRQLTGGDLSDKGLTAIAARMTPSQLAIALRHDPGERRAALYGLTPGWENLSLGGKPSLDFGASGLEAQQLNAAMPVSGLLRFEARGPEIQRRLTAQRQVLPARRQAVQGRTPLARIVPEGDGQLRRGHARGDGGQTLVAQIAAGQLAHGVGATVDLGAGGRAGGHGHTDRRQGGGRRGGEPATSLAHRCPVDPGQRQLRMPAGMPARPTSP